MFACTGIPVMGMAIGDLASLIIEYNRKIRFDNLTNQSFGRGNSFFMDMQSLDTSNQQLKQHQNSQQNSQQNNNHYSPPQEIPELDDNIYDHNNIDGPQVVISPLHTNITNLTYSILTHSEESTDTTTKDIQLPISQRSPLEYTTFDTDNSNKVNDILLNTTNTATNTATNTDTIINENADIIRSIRPATIINENADITRSIRPATVGINNSNSDRSQSSRQTDQINTSTLTQSEFVIIELVRLNVVSKSMVKAMIDKYNNQR